jgi:hypothetical protein
MQMKEDALALAALTAAGVVCVISWCYPWQSLRSGRGKIALQLPWLAAALFVLYNVLLSGYSIRVDLLLLLPVFLVFGGITLGLYIIRMARLLWK